MTVDCQRSKRVEWLFKHDEHITDAQQKLLPELLTKLKTEIIEKIG